MSPRQRQQINEQCSLLRVFEAGLAIDPEFMAAASHVDSAELGLGLVRRDDAAPQQTV